MGRIGPLITRVLAVVAIVPIAVILNNFYRNQRNLLLMAEMERDFRAEDIQQNQRLKDSVGKLGDEFGVILLNRHALNITLNWMCNTRRFEDVHKRVLFIVMDEYTRKRLRDFYPESVVFVWHDKFLPYDATYMSFFLMRTNMIKALQSFNKPFWMLQADTIWRRNLFTSIDTSSFDADILLDQQGYSGTASIRQKVMNGANFFLPVKQSTSQLVSLWLEWQKWVYITDPDLVKMFCLRNDFRCEHIPYSIACGWEWVYGDQKDAPIMIQMDGETAGNKEKVLDEYGFWFLNKDLMCIDSKVDNAIESMETGKVPRVFSESKKKEEIVLKIGEIMNQIPIFGHFSSIYGGLASLYLRVF